MHFIVIVWFLAAATTSTMQYLSSHYKWFDYDDYNYNNTVNVYSRSFYIGAVMPHSQAENHFKQIVQVKFNYRSYRKNFLFHF